MSHFITLSLSGSEIASLSREASAAGAGVEDFARHLLFSPRLSPDLANLEVGQLQSDLRQLLVISRRLEQKIELVYQLSYFFGKKMATSPSEFHAFVLALKQRGQGQED
jgi:hypothetical protein